MTLRRVLMIAYHYPPFVGSSGSRRTLAFSRYLPRYGWEPIVLSVNVRAYETTSQRELGEVPAGLKIIRSFALDTARHLAIAGRYPGWLAVPDRWWSWKTFGVRDGLAAIRDCRPDVIWSTYPIASAHAIGARLALRSGLPWIADMRDPMVEFDRYSGIAYPVDRRVREARLAIERVVADRAAHVVFCTAGARSICVERYGGDAARRFSVIANGFDEEAFEGAARNLPPPAAHAGGFRLVHSGTVYPGDDRSPGPLFQALARLRDVGKLPAGFRLILRATGYDEIVARLAAAAGVTELVELAQSLPYREALQEMLRADGLLLLQGSASNPAIPAKLYEYLRAQRPVLALVHPEGDSAALLTQLNGATLARLDDHDSIARALEIFFAGCASGTAQVVTPEVAARYSRASQTAELAALLDRVAAS